MAKTNTQVRIKKSRANSLYDKDKLAEAKPLFQQLTIVNSRDAESWYKLGTINWKLGNLDEAVEELKKAYHLEPNNPQLCYTLGCVLLNGFEKSDAEHFLQQAIRLKPDYIEAYTALATILATSSRLEEAAAYYRKSMTFCPSHPLLASNLANVLASQGKTKEAIENWRSALAADPGYASAHSNLLLCLNYHSDTDLEGIFKEHLSWAQRHEKPLLKHSFTHNNKDHVHSAEQPLRIGYVTADFREHSVAYFLEPILCNHDTENFNIYCYSDVSRPDSTTERMKKYVPHYRDISTYSDEDVAKLIYSDKIDILIDLSGHTSGNRLRVFAYKPAPLQLTYLGYPNTTGMASMDYRITDAYADPPGATECLHSENLYRLPGCFLCYRPPQEQIEIGPLPAIKNGFVTFGAFNAVAKTTPDVISLWASILQKCPNSRLMLKNKSFADEHTAQRYINIFTELGISQSRIDIVGLTPSKNDHFEVFNSIDIALDTFPYNGTTTTCDTLWMGVPVITLRGKSHPGLVGVSLLERLNMREFIADNTEEYVEIALRLVENPDSLSKFRGNLRKLLLSSELCNGPLFTKNLESAYLDMWQKHITQ